MVNPTSSERMEPLIFRKRIAEPYQLSFINRCCEKTGQKPQDFLSTLLLKSLADLRDIMNDENKKQESMKRWPL